MTLSQLRRQIIYKVLIFTDVETGDNFEVTVLGISLLSTIVFIIVAVSSVKRYVSCINFIDICQLTFSN